MLLARACDRDADGAREQGVAEARTSLSFRRLSFSWHGRVTSSANAQEGLNRPEQRVEQMTARDDDLAAIFDTLASELITSYEDSQCASLELKTMRGRRLQVTPRTSCSASGS